MKIILATNNANKLREAREIFSPLGIDILSQKDAGISVNPEENGKTFAENALIKARAVHELVKLPVIADDSGLCVDALDGAPGVYSARYAPENLLCETLLQNMQNVPDGERTAKFVTAAVFIDENGKELCFEGVCSGTIAHERKGTNGFGYDPIFLYENVSFAELDPEQKNAVSHRGKAFRKIYDYLTQTLQEGN